MAGPPPYFFTHSLVLPQRDRHPDELERPSPPARLRLRKRPSSSRQGIAAQTLAWVAGVGGYVGLWLAGHGSRHADDLHAVAVVWLIVFAALNANLILARR